MDANAFNKFLHQLKHVSVTEDKMFLLQRKADKWCFTPQQIIEIANCFPHSHDKKCVLNVLAKRIGGKFEWHCASRLIKSAMYSSDRLAMLKNLIEYMEPLSDQDSRKFVALTFDLQEDRRQAYQYISEVNGRQEDSEVDFDAIYFDEGPNMLVIYDIIEEYAKNQAHDTVFDLDLFCDPSFLREFLVPQKKEEIRQEIVQRQGSDRNFFIPSMVSSICTNLRPGRRQNGERWRQSARRSQSQPAIVVRSNEEPLGEFRRNDATESPSKETSRQEQTEEETVDTTDSGNRPPGETASRPSRRYLKNTDRHNFDRQSRHTEFVADLMNIPRNCVRSTSAINRFASNRKYMQKEFLPTGSFYSRNGASVR